MCLLGCPTIWLEAAYRPGLCYLVDFFIFFLFNSDPAFSYFLCSSVFQHVCFDNLRWTGMLALFSSLHIIVLPLLHNLRSVHGFITALLSLPGSF